MSKFTRFLLYLVLVGVGFESLTANLLLVSAFERKAASLVGEVNADLKLLKHNIHTIRPKFSDAHVGTVGIQPVAFDKATQRLRELWEKPRIWSSSNDDKSSSSEALDWKTSLSHPKSWSERDENPGVYVLVVPPDGIVRPTSLLEDSVYQSGELGEHHNYDRQELNDDSFLVTDVGVRSRWKHPEYYISYD